MLNKQPYELINGHASHKAILCGGREQIKTKPPFKSMDYKAFWQAERERLKQGKPA